MLHTHVSSSQSHVGFLVGRVCLQWLVQDPHISASPELDEKLRLRAPYVAPLNVLQVFDVTMRYNTIHCMSELEPAPALASKPIIRSWVVYDCIQFLLLILCYTIMFCSAKPPP
jgi:hypothetical protein